MIRVWAGGFVLMCLASTPGRAAAVAAALPTTIPSVIGGATPAAVDGLFETAAASLVPIFTDPADAEPAVPPTAVYDISAHVVVMPDGARLEAHSGLGERVDDPRSVRRHMRGATPPALYDLTRRKGLFHGVMALRMIPLEGEVFGRTGLLTHTYMLHGRPESNGCVVFRDYGAFLNAFREGRIKRLRVVPSVGDAALRGA